MKRLPEVDVAADLMAEAMTWSVMKWLREKKRVRKTADEANAALDRLSDQVKQRLPANVRTAYQALAFQVSAGEPKEPVRGKPLSLPPDPAACRIAQELKRADDEAYRARMSAEQAFDEAEKKLSTSLAREGCAKAIHSWELHQQAISRADKYAIIQPLQR